MPKPTKPTLEEAVFMTCEKLVEYDHEGTAETVLDFLEGGTLGHEAANRIRAELLLDTDDVPVKPKEPLTNYDKVYDACKADLEDNQSQTGDRVTLKMVKANIAYHMGSLNVTLSAKEKRDMVTALHHVMN